MQNSEVAIYKSLGATIKNEKRLSLKSFSDGFDISRVDGISIMKPRNFLGGNDYFLGPEQHLPDSAPEVDIETVSTTTSITIGVNAN
ncbi:hypothetical protein [Rahnella victoriana]|uniref:hypothetical protein n=1 Tax=Rahnella victoriana TaxID=1510570 RepID=UPI0013C485E0|nr:hypothetical protein [Rahnella victoriana]UHM89766.1 hypothetical protein J9880_15830 [Rahnella victoriana]